MTEVTTLSATVDRLAFIKAQIADLREEESKLKDALIASDQSVVESSFYRCTIVTCAGRPIVDWQTIAMKFNPSRQLIAGNTKQGESFVQIRVVARKTS
jgi:uncharacterized protein YqfA (UPF0365 family)